MPRLLRQDAAWPARPPALQAAHARGEVRVPMLPAQWFEETLARARALLPRDDPFMRALEGQREPVEELALPVPGDEP